MKKYLIFKENKFLLCEVIRENWIFNNNIYELIETNENPNENFIKNKWNNYYWIEGATFEEIQEQENQQKQQLKQQAYEELLPTDWYVVRFIETGIAIPQEILDQRQAIRNKYE